MKRFCYFVVLSLIATVANATEMTPAQNRGRGGQVSQMRSAPRATAPKATAVTIGTKSTDATESNVAVAVDNVKPTVKPTDTPEYKARKAACLDNNIGMGDTFVWASRYSNTDSYATMIEDMDVPENNTCFVKVTLKSNDAKIDIDESMAHKYYEWNRDITCGGWVDQEKMRKLILDEKKSARTWGTVAAAVGGAGVGVGAMELFGNKLIGHGVEGQKWAKIAVKNEGDAYVDLLVTIFTDEDGKGKKKADGIQDVEDALEKLAKLAIKCETATAPDTEKCNDARVEVLKNRFCDVVKGIRAKDDDFTFSDVVVDPDTYECKTDEAEAYTGGKLTKK